MHGCIKTDNVLVFWQLWMYLIFERLVYKHIELLHAADLQIINSQNVVSFVELYCKWRACPPSHTVAHKTCYLDWFFSRQSYSFWHYYFDISHTFRLCMMSNM